MAIDKRHMGVIRWEDPPPARDPHAHGYRPWAIVAAELRAKPGDWALIDEATSNPAYAARITGGSSWWAPRGSFETRVSYMDEHGWLNIYARYVGD